MRVGLVAHLAHVGLIGRVHMHVLLAVAAVGEAPRALEEVAHERLLSCRTEKRNTSGSDSEMTIDGFDDCSINTDTVLNTIVHVQ